MLECLLWEELASWAVCITADVSKVTVHSDWNICNYLIYFVLYSSTWKYLNCDVMWGVCGWRMYMFTPTPYQTMWWEYRLMWSAGQILTDLTLFRTRCNKMDRVEENVRRLLDGRALEDSHDLCDFTLEEQNEATGNLSLFWGHSTTLRWGVLRACICDGPLRLELTVHFSDILTRFFFLC